MLRLVMEPKRVLSYNSASRASAMSEAIQKAWLADYIASYAEEHGSEMLQHKPKKGKVQIIHVSAKPSYAFLAVH